MPSLVSELGGVVRRWRFRGHDVFAAEAGEGPLVLLVHGIYAGSSSYEYRKLFPLLARRHRVVAIDLLGCGLSERPNITYTPDLFVEQVVAALAAFGPQAAALVGSSLGGAFSARAATALRERIGSLVLICPTGLAGTLDGPPKPAQDFIRRLVLRPGIGEAFFNMLASRPSLSWFLRNQAYADPKSATPDVVEYYWIATHQEGSRYVPAHFVGGALNLSIAGDLPRVPVPVLVAWGEHATGTSPISSAHCYVELASNAELTTFASSRLLPHEEEPELFAERLEQFFARVASRLS